MKEMKMEEKVRRDILQETELSQSFTSDNFEDMENSKVTSSSHQTEDMAE